MLSNLLYGPVFTFQQNVNSTCGYNLQNMDVAKTCKLPH